MQSVESMDPITVLAQRDAIRVQFDSAITRARNHSAMLSVLCLDLADLRAEVDSSGRDAGPAPTQLADRVRRHARRSDLVAPLNDNVCVVVTEFMEGPHAARRMADRLLDALQTPAARSSSAQRGARIGIATASGAQLEGEHPLRRAHRAMLQARLEPGSQRVVAATS